MKLLKSLFSLFRKQEPPKHTTTIDNSVVTDEDLSQQDIIIEKMRNRTPLTMTDINLTLSDLFDIKAIDGTLHRLNKTLIDQAVFVIESVHLNTDNNDIPLSVTIMLQESIFNLKMEVVIDASTFHEIFTPVKLATIT